MSCKIIPGHHYDYAYNMKNISSQLSSDHVARYRTHLHQTETEIEA